MRRTKSIIKIFYVNGLKQTPIDHDFHITPVLTFGRGDKNEIGDLGTAWGIAFEWGHWAVGIGVYSAYLNNQP